MGFDRSLAGVDIGLLLVLDHFAVVNISWVKVCSKRTILNVDTCMHD